MNDRKEELILKYLELIYGKSDVWDDGERIGINRVCVYCKKTKQIGWTGRVHLDLVNWFGDGRYFQQLKQWFSKKYNLEVI